MSTDPSLVTVLTDWTFEPSVLLGVILAAGIYAAGVRELARRGRLQRSVSPWHMVLFGLGLLSIVLALVSPIDALSGQLLSMHMVQHLLLLLIAPPLLLLGKPIPVLVVGAPRSLVRWLARSHVRVPWFRRLTNLLIAPWFAWLASSFVLLIWHLPALYDAALRNTGIHLVEHLCFLITGLMFWWVIIQPLPGRPRLAFGWRLLFTVAGMVPGSALGQAFALAAGAVYPYYVALPRLWGVSAVDDQVLAGNLMWIGGDLILACAIIPLFGGMMERLEEKELARFARMQNEEG